MLMVARRGGGRWSEHPSVVSRVAGDQAFWLVGGGQKVWAGRKCHKILREQSGTEVDHRSVDGREWQEHGLVGRGVMEELCVKILKFEIVNSRNSFHYFSRVVLRTIDLSRPFCFLLGGLKIGFKMACFKIDRMTLDIQVKICDCRVWVGPYPPCTLNAVAGTWIFDGVWAIR